jgi:hypothetical protein
VDVPITDVLSVQPELLYAMGGAKVNFLGFGGEIKINYVEIPILLRANARSGASARPFLVVGPALGFVTSAKQSVEGFGEEDIKDDVDGFNFGFAVGGGVEFGIASVEARYTFGLTAFAILFGVRFGPR